MLNLLKTLTLCAGLTLPSAAATANDGANGLSSAEIDTLVLRAMESFNVPGIAVGVIKDGKVVHSKGYGLRNAAKSEKVDNETLFSIGSTGKSFTAGALAKLVDAGKITWDDKVIDYIPEFRMQDAWVTSELSIRDLLIHNSGLGLGSGDLMFFPTASFTRQEIIENLRHLKPVTSFRTTYAYDNLMYIVAGEVIRAVSGKSYEDFIDDEVLAPLGMEHCVANLKHTEKLQNIADPHVFEDGQYKLVERDVKPGHEVVFAAAGGMLCSVESMLKWHAIFMNGGRLPDGSTFLSEEQVAEIMTPQNIMPLSEDNKKWFGSSFSTYGLAWRVMDFHGYKMVHHSGGLLGMLSRHAMIPELGLGVVIYTNQQAGSARPAILYQILEAYMAGDDPDWVARYEQRQKDFLERAELAKQESAQTEAADIAFELKPYELDAYAGKFEDVWFGEIVISKERDVLRFSSKKSTRLVGSLVPSGPGIFIVRWDERELNADAYLKFSTNFTGEPEGFTMKAVSPYTDFSFDFHDLNFKRVNPEQGGEQ